MQIEPTRLVAARLVRNMSQEEVAIAADLSARTIQRIEAGQSASLESTKALLTTFGADILHDPDAEDGAVVLSPWLSLAARTGRVSQVLVNAGFAGLRLLFAAVFLLVALAKPFVPDQTGLFVRGNEYTVGVLSFVPIGSQELLGYWIIPILALVALAILLSIARIREFVWERVQPQMS